MKKINLIFGFSLIGLLTISSCMNQNSKQAERLKSEPQKQSLWTDSLKTDFIAKNSKTDFDKNMFTELISKYEFDKNVSNLKEFMQTQEFESYKNSKTKAYVVNIDDLAGKSKKEIEKLIGKPNHKEKVNPSKTPCPCDKYNYLNDLVEIVFINGKADWITVNNSSTYAKIGNSISYQSINKFDDYTYVKVETK